MKKQRKFVVGDFVVGSSYRPNDYIGKVVDVVQGFAGKGSQLLTIECPVSKQRNTINACYCVPLTKELLLKLRGDEIARVMDRYDTIISAIMASA